MSYVTIPKTCELCNHPLVFFPKYGKSFCPVCEKKQLQRFSEWIAQRKESSESSEEEEED